MAGAGLITHSTAPFNAEPDLPRLRSSFITPQAALYVRSHGDVPRVDPADYRLRVTGHVAQELDLTLDEIRTRFSERSVTATLQCAGNRRSDLQCVRRTSGDPWAAGAIGTVNWAGVSLADVLHAAGAPSDSSLHVAFDCCDHVEAPEHGRFRYGVSIGMEKALAPETLLATGMNGEALDPDHGFPLRAVVPGFAGVRSAKWLTTITVQDQPSSNPMQQHDYKLLPPHLMAKPKHPGAGVTIDEMPLNSALCEPAPGAVLRAGTTMLRGYAAASPGRRVTRVDVSGDGGANWLQAGLDQPDGGPWSWIFWTAELLLPPGPAELAVRAWDSAGQTQPSSAAEVWNVCGYLCTAWHRVPVTITG